MITTTQDRANQDDHRLLRALLRVDRETLCDDSERLAAQIVIVRERLHRNCCCLECRLGVS